MQRVGFEPTRPKPVDLKSTPLDQLGHPCENTQIKTYLYLYQHLGLVKRTTSHIWVYKKFAVICFFGIYTKNKYYVSSDLFNTSSNKINIVSNYSEFLYASP